MTAVVVAGQAKLSHYDAPQNGARNSFTPRLGDTLSKHTRMWKTIGVFNGWEEGIAASVLWNTS